MTTREKCRKENNLLLLMPHFFLSHKHISFILLSLDYYYSFSRVKHSLRLEPRLKCDKSRSKLLINFMYLSPSIERYHKYLLPSMYMLTNKTDLLVLNVIIAFLSVSDIAESFLH